MYVLATEPPPSTTTQPIPTYAPDELPYKATSDYVWSKFNNNATKLFAAHCTIGDGVPKENCDFKDWGGPQCSDKSNECIGNGPLGMGSSVILGETATASSKVNSPKTMYP